MPGGRGKGVGNGRVCKDGILGVTTELCLEVYLFVKLGERGTLWSLVLGSAGRWEEKNLITYNYSSSCLAHRVVGAYSM